MTDAPLFAFLSVACTAGALVCLLAFVYFRLRGTRPELAIGVPVAVGLTLKVVAAAGVSLLPFGQILRGADELKFIGDAEILAAEGVLSDAGLDAMSGELHVWLFALQLQFGELPDMALRLSQVAIASMGLLLLTVAVYDLKGRRAAVLSAWLVALEPSGMFFGSLLHKEPLIALAAGLVGYGGSRMWRLGGSAGLGLMMLGCAVAVGARPYAGWCLVGATALMILHSVRAHATRKVSSGLVGVVTLAGIIAALPLLQELSSSESELSNRLQRSQAALVADKDAALALAPVDFSSRSGVLLGLPIRIRDVLFKPYPWQTDNLSQQLGAIGALLALLALGYLVLQLFRNRGRILSSAGPFLYPATGLLVAYSLSSGNAGQSFRYRVNVIALGLCTLVVLRERWLTAAEGEERRPSQLPADWVRRLGQLRRDGGMTHRDLARRLGVTPWELNGFFTGVVTFANMSPEVRERLRQLLEAPAALATPGLASAGAVAAPRRRRPAPAPAPAVELRRRSVESAPADAPLPAAPPPVAPPVETPRAPAAPEPAARRVAVPPAVSPPPEPAARRRRLRLAVAAGCGAVALAVAGVVTALQRDDSPTTPEPSTTRAPQVAPTATPGPSADDVALAEEAREASAAARRRALRRAAAAERAARRSERRRAAEVQPVPAPSPTPAPPAAAPPPPPVDEAPPDEDPPPQDQPEPEPEPQKPQDEPGRTPPATPDEGP